MAPTDFAESFTASLPEFRKRNRRNYDRQRSVSPELHLVMLQYS